MGASQRHKGKRVELEIVNAHKEMGLNARRIPAFTRSLFEGKAGHDVEIELSTGKLMRAEVKARKGGSGWVSLEKWLSNHDALFLKRNNGDPLVVVPWKIYALLVGAKQLN